MTWFALVYVRNQTPAIGLAAVKQNGFAIKYVRDDALYDTLVALVRYCTGTLSVAHATPNAQNKPAGIK